NWQISLHQRFADRRPNESLHIAGHTGAAATAQRLRQFADNLRQRRLGLGKLGFRSRNNHVLWMETVIHQLADRLSMKQLFGITIEQQIDSPDMNSEMICLSEEHTVS